MCAVTGFLGTIGSYFFGTAGTATAAGAATGATSIGGAEAATAAAALEGGSTAATAAATAGAAATGVGGAVAAGGALTTGAGIATTVSEAAAVASGASALATLANGPGRINIPPVPVNQPQTDQAVLNAQQQEIQREAAAGGLQSTVGTAGGQGGAILNPSTMSSRSILGG
jgi:hypothetical protein